MTEFAGMIGRLTDDVREILDEEGEITAEMAQALAEALGTSAKLWLNLQVAYRSCRHRTVQGERENH